MSLLKKRLRKLETDHRRAAKSGRLSLRQFQEVLIESGIYWEIHGLDGPPPDFELVPHDAVSAFEHVNLEQVEAALAAMYDDERRHDAARNRIQS